MREDQNKPLVSVCIPLYNHENYVVECIQSIIDQSYENIELIIIDDGSKDLSASKIAPLATLCEQRFIRFKFISRENKGLSKSLNEMVGWCEGKYFSVMASDDIALKNKIQILVEYLEKNEHCAAVSGGIELIDCDGKSLGIRRPRFNSYSFKDILLLKHKIYAPASMVRLNLLREIGGFDESTTIEDWSLWLALSHKGYQLHVIDELLTKYRQHDSNLSKNYLLIHSELRKIIENYKPHPYYKKSLQILNCVKFRDSAKFDKLSAIKMLPKVSLSVTQPRLYQGLLHLLFKW